MKLDFIQTIYNHPFNSKNKNHGLARYLKWQLLCRLSDNPIYYPFTENSRLLLEKGVHGSDANFYCGLIEFNEMGFLLHFLRQEDLFVDIGANVGAFTILASAEINAKSISIEPIPSTFKRLTEHIKINQIENQVEALNIGLGSKSGSIKFTETLDTVNHVAVDGEQNTIDIKVSTLDSVILDQKPALLKIDVEGFETEVLNGSTNTLKSDDLKAIIIELNGSGDRYGYDENKIHLQLLDHGFKPFIYHPLERKLKEIKTYGSNNNTIYIRDLEFVKNKIENARKIKVGNSQQLV